MKTLAILTLAAVLLAPALVQAQEDILPPAPADWGELAEMLAELWGLEVNPNPSGGNAAINALNLIGIGKASYEAIMGLEVEDNFPIMGDGYDPDNWLPEQELTGDFICMLKMVTWAAVYIGLVPYYKVPVSSGPDDPLSPEEEALAHDTAEQAVVDLVTTAQRDGGLRTGRADALLLLRRRQTGNQLLVGGLPLSRSPVRSR